MIPEEREEVKNQNVVRNIQKELLKIEVENLIGFHEM